MSVKAIICVALMLFIVGALVFLNMRNRRR